MKDKYIDLLVILIGIGFAVGVVVGRATHVNTVTVTAQKIVYATTTVTVLGEQTKCENAGGKFSVTTILPSLPGQSENVQYYGPLPLDFNCTIAPKQLWDFTVNVQ